MARGNTTAGAVLQPPPIDLGNIANLDNLAKPSNGGCLIGLLIEHDSEYKAMVATRMSVILREIKQRV
jgi:hypothetical protein